MNLLRTVSAYVRTEHDVVRAISVHILLVKITGEELDVASTTVDLLLVLDSELDYKGLSLIRERLIELGRDTIKPGVLRCLQT